MSYNYEINAYEYRIIEIEIPNRIFRGSKTKYLLQRLGGYGTSRHRWFSYHLKRNAWRQVTSDEYKSGYIRNFTFDTEQLASDGLQSYLASLKEEERDYIEENTKNTFKLKIEIIK